MPHTHDNDVRSAATDRRWRCILGLGGKLAMSDPEVIEGLAQHFRVVIFENRGTGGTDKLDHPYTIKMCRRSIAHYPAARPLAARGRR